MRKLILVIIILFFLFFSSSPVQAMEFYFCGINIKNINSKKALAGAALSLVTHIIGHLLCLEIQDKDWKLEIKNSMPVEHSLSPLSNKEDRWCARSGFLLQNIIGFSLAHFKKTKENEFTKGYITFNLIHTLTYPIRYQEEGDFYLIDHHDGSGTTEWSLYSGIAFYNSLRISP